MSRKRLNDWPKTGGVASDGPWPVPAEDPSPGMATTVGPRSAAAAAAAAAVAFSVRTSPAFSSFSVAESIKSFHIASGGSAGYDSCGVFEPPLLCTMTPMPTQSCHGRARKQYAYY